MPGCLIPPQWCLIQGGALPTAFDPVMSELLVGEDVASHPGHLLLRSDVGQSEITGKTWTRSPGQCLPCATVCSPTVCVAPRCECLVIRAFDTLPHHSAAGAWNRPSHRADVNLSLAGPESASQVWEGQRLLDGPACLLPALFPGHLPAIPGGTQGFPLVPQA